MAVLAVLLAATIGASDSAPASLVGHVIVANQSLSGQADITATFDQLYTYFSNGDSREKYSYQKLDATHFRLTGFNPDDPNDAWSHLLFTFTNANSGTMFDEDWEQLKGTFELFAPEPPELIIQRQTPTHVQVVVKSLAGQMLVVEESTDMSLWISVATNISWAGRWEFPLPATPTGERFFRAYVPSQ
jgi:hypothetical protein